MPPDAQAAIRGHNAGMVPGEHRDDVLDLMPGGVAVGDGRDLRGPFKLPKIILAYLKTLTHNDV